MSKIRGIRAASDVPDDLAKRLGTDGVNEILMILWQGFHDLVSDPACIFSEDTWEDDITREWYGKILMRWKDWNKTTIINIGPAHQYPETHEEATKRGRAPAIDFCFRDWDTSNSYFGAECKNLYKDKNDKIKRYVETGVDHYTEGRYAAQSSESAMIGYVLSGSIPDIVKRIAGTMADSTMPCSRSLLENLTREKVPDPQYRSKHLRNLDGKDIILHHLFFDFT